MAKEERRAPLAHEREPGTGTKVSDMVNLTFAAPRSMRDDIPKRVQAKYVRSETVRQRSPWWKFWAR